MEHSKTELEDTIRWHNRACDLEYESLYQEWLFLRNQAWDCSDPLKLKHLKAQCDTLHEQMMKVQSKKLDYKESA